MSYDGVLLINDFPNPEIRFAERPLQVQFPAVPEAHRNPTLATQRAGQKLHVDAGQLQRLRCFKVVRAKGADGGTKECNLRKRGRRLKTIFFLCLFGVQLAPTLGTHMTPRQHGTHPNTSRDTATEGDNDRNSETGRARRGITSFYDSPL